MDNLEKRVRDLENSIILEEEIDNVKRRISKLESNSRVHQIILVILIALVIYLLS